MRVVHVTSSTAGGAGIAAMRIHSALRAASCDSRVLCLRDPSPRPDSGVEIFPTRFSRFWERGALRMGIPLTTADRSAALRDKLGIRGMSFSEPDSDYDVSSHPLIRSADVVHLHWVGGFLDWKSFFRAVGKPVVWTLHDLNPIMGGFHCEADKDGASEAAMRHEAELIVRKAGLLDGFGKLRVIGPSTRITRLSSQSTILGRFPHSVIAHPIDSKEWRPFERKAARDVLDLPADGKILLTVAEQAGLKRKGAGLLEAALADPSLAGKYLWVAIGTPDGLPAGAHALGFLADQRLLALAYSAADLVVTPSVEESFGNVVVESMMVGTPVVGFPVGGVEEIIDDGANGTLASALNSRALADAIRRCGGTSFDRERIRTDTARKYDPVRIAREYVSVYDSLLS